MARPTAIFVLSVFTVLKSLPAFAQTPDLTQSVKPGDVVAVTGLDQERMVGRVRALTSGTITLDAPGGPRTIATGSIGRVIVKDSLHNGTMIGLAIGVAGGAIGGWALGTLCANETGACPAGVAMIVGMGAAAGAGIGAFADSMHVRTAYRAGIEFPSEFSPEASVDFGSGFISDYGSRQRTPFSLGGKWRYMHASGVGVEFEANRAFGQVGPIEEGISKIASESAKLVYALPGHRIRPYVTGGGAVSQVERHRLVAFMAGNQLHVFHGVGHEVRPELLAGGGVRVAVTSHVSVGPDVTVAFGGGGSRVRASMGVAYRW